MQTNKKLNKLPAANKQIGKRAGERLRLNDSTKLNGSNSIQHLC